MGVGPSLAVVKTNTHLYLVHTTYLLYIFVHRHVLLIPYDFAGEIDREEMASHSFHVTATDGSGLTATVVYSISVTDENDNTPYFSLGNLYHIDIDEDQDLNEVNILFTFGEKLM